MIDVLFVNYHCVDDLLAAARSVLAESPAVHLWLVDNSGSPAEADALQQAAADWPATVLVAPENLGFGKACNWAFAEGRAPYVFLLNPDVRLQPGALAALSDTLDRRPEVAAVGPAIYWDEGLAWRICSSLLPSPRRALWQGLQQATPLRSLFEVMQRRSRLAHLDAVSPFAVDNLSGGHVLLRRAMLADGLFDERFFMYYEDTDLFLRLQQAGYRMLEVPQAKVCHIYLHHAGKDQMMAAAEPLYVEKHFPRAGWYRSVARYLPSARYSSEVHALDGGGDAIIPVPGDWQAGWLLELSLSPAFTSALVLRGSGCQALVAAALLERLAGRRYLRLSSAGRWWQPSVVYSHG